MITDRTLIVHLPVDETTGSTAEDVSLFGNDGTYNGTMSTAGLFANARIFDGMNDNIESTLSAQTPALDGDLSVSAWFKTDVQFQAMGNNSRALAWKADENNFSGFSLGAFIPGSNQLSFQVYGEDGAELAK